ncbi:unnamed protein product [Alopecurus aequalis]
MEAVAVSAAATAGMVDLNTLSRRELQALCKLNGVRANMTNLAMVEALQSLPSVDGIDQVGTTLCLPTPGKSAMKSALRTAAAPDQQQQGSPLPRGRRVSVKSPEAIRMDVEEEEDETKRDLFRDIVRTPGVALRSTSRRPRATPAPLPTPAAGTLRRSQRSTARKATAPVEEVEVSTAQTRKTATPMAMIDLDQEEEDAAAAVPEEAKVQQVESKGVTSDDKCDDPEEEEEEEATQLPEEGNNKLDEAEQAEEGAAIEEEQKVVNAEKSAPLSAMEDSPILGVLSKASPELAMKNVENASTEDREVFGNLSPLLEIRDEINCPSEDKEVVAVELPEEAVKEDVINSTIEAVTAPNKIPDEINCASEDKEVVAVEVPEEAIEEVVTAPNKIVSAAVTEKEVPVDELLQADLKDDESAEKYDLVGESSEVVDLDDMEEDMPNADRIVDEESDETIAAAAETNKMVPAAVAEKDVSVDELPQADLTDDESVEEIDLDGESSEEADLTEESSEVDDLDEEEEEDMLYADQTVDEESDYTIEVSGSIDVNFDSDEEEEQLNMLETGEVTKASDSLTEEEDDFSGDLSSEFDDVLDFSDAETASDNSPVALEGSNAAAAYAAKTTESVVTEEKEVSSEDDVVSHHINTFVKSLDEVTIAEEKKEECVKEKKQLIVGKEMSLRKLKSAYKESLIAAKEGKKLTIASDEGSRVALAELDDNVEC